ncbi:outer membrane beta-barrel protein [Hymenobacter rubidus]|uniref:outer membrane beta-barrel protein n=1 Tax=Hymenobacter rubidus TaxID=1441626 RepID=UPI00191F1742|nr:outer membrane beta-barrel protein [Hymenobacter rubidus]
MKKILTVLTLTVATVGTANAQKPASTIGITAAYGRTSLLGNNEYTPVNHSAYQAGLTADAYLSEAVSFHPEVLYTLQYFDATALDLLSRDVTYLNVPLLARYHAGGLFFEAGPEVNFALKAVNEGGENVKTQVNPVVLDYVVGLGYQLNHGPSIGVRYDGGASNVFKSDASTVLGRGAFKSSSFWLSLGYSFGG